MDGKGGNLNNLSKETLVKMIPHIWIWVVAKCTVEFEDIIMETHYIREKLRDKDLLRSCCSIKDCYESVNGTEEEVACHQCKKAICEKHSIYNQYDETWICILCNQGAQ